MRVRTSKSKLGTRFYIIKTYYDTKGKNWKTRISPSISPLPLLSQRITATPLMSVTFSCSGSFTIWGWIKYAPPFRRIQTFPLTSQIYCRNSVTAEFLTPAPKSEHSNSPKLSFSSRILIFIRCTALWMLSVKTLMIYSQSFTAIHLNSEKEKPG